MDVHRVSLSHLTVALAATEASQLDYLFRQLGFLFSCKRTDYQTFTLALPSDHLPLTSYLVFEATITQARAPGACARLPIASGIT